LIFSGQLTKEEAFLELEKPVYPEEQLEIDKTFVLKKLGFSKEEFAAYINAPSVPHDFYGNSLDTYQTSYVKARHFLGRIKRKLFS
jgi:hypothetical protein